MATENLKFGDGSQITASNEVVRPSQTNSKSQTITSDVLADKSTPYKLPPVTPDTLSEGTQEYIAAQNESIKSARQQEHDLQKETLKNDRNDIKSLLADLGNEGKYREDFYKEEKVDQYKKEVDDYTSQLEAEQRANTKRIESIRKNTGGMFAGAVEQEVRRVNSESISKQADLAILQNVSMRKYSTAAEIADRKLQAMMEPMRAKLESLKFFYSENKADFNKEDDRIYSELIAKQDREYQEKLAKETENNEWLKMAITSGANAAEVKQLTDPNMDDGAKKLLAQDIVARISAENRALEMANTRSAMANRGGSGSSGGVLGLSNQQIDNISPLVTQFQNSPIVQNYNTIGEGYQFAKSLSNDTTNPADDQALIYALAKALDPGSVVREGEYATAQKYAQSLVQSYGKSVTQALQGSGFLSKDARENIKATIESRFKASEVSYKNLYSETQRRVNLIGNTDKGDQLLNNYGGAFAQPSSGSMATSGSSAPSGDGSILGQVSGNSASSSDGFWKKSFKFLFGD